MYVQQQPQQASVTQQELMENQIKELRHLVRDVAIRLRLAKSKTLPLDARAFENLLTCLEGERFGHLGRGAYDILHEMQMHCGELASSEDAATAAGQGNGAPSLGSASPLGGGVDDAFTNWARGFDW